MSENKAVKAEGAVQQPLKDQFEPFSVRKASDRNFVTVLARGMDVLRAFRAHDGPLGNAEIAELTGVPKATISRITHTLRELGYLEQKSNRGKYRLSVAMLTLAYPVLSQSRSRQLAHDKLAELANATGCTVALVAPNTDQTSMVYLDVFTGDTSNTLRMDIGTRLDMATGAAGRAFLAGLDEESRAIHYRELAATHGEAWPKLRDRIEDSCKQINDRGFCLVDGEWMKAARAVAAPLPVDQDGTTLAVSCGAPNFSASTEQFQNILGPHLVHVTQQLERLLRS